MASREQRAAAYDKVVKALRHAASIDGFMERVAIAKAMDALGVIISDTSATVVKRAINFRNGVLLRDCHLPVDTYLQKDPEPVSWVFHHMEILEWPMVGGLTLHAVLVDEAYSRAKEQMPHVLSGFSDRWWGEVEVDGKYYRVTLYPDDSVQLAMEDEPKPPILNETPPGLLPTILIEFERLLGMGCKGGDTVQITAIMQAHAILKLRKPEQHAKLTDSWWAKVDVTDIGYLVTFHYSGEFPPRKDYPKEK